jgi:HEAT repeat protein
MPGYTTVPGGGNAYATIPAAPPVIAAAPSAGVVAAGYPLVAQRSSLGSLPELAAPEPIAIVDASLTSQELLMTLRGSLYPSQREWAADRLKSCDWKAEPQVVEGLIAAARTDPAPLVRVGCLKALAKMHAASEAAVAVATELKNDADARVRLEAEQTLAELQAVRQMRARN